MKHIFFIFLLIVFVGCNNSTSQTTNTQSIDKEEVNNPDNEEETEGEITPSLYEEFPFSDTKIYLTSSYSFHNEDDKKIYYTSFLNFSETLFEKSEDNQLGLTQTDFAKDTIQFSVKQRSKMLDLIGISDEDSIFVYDSSTDKIHTLQVKDFPAMACVNVYSEENDRGYNDFEYGLDLGKFAHSGYTYVGKECPFQEGKFKKAVWKKADFPFRLRLKDFKEAHLSDADVTFGNAYKTKYEHFDFYVQDFLYSEETHPAIASRFLVIVDTNTQKTVYTEYMFQFDGVEFIDLADKEELEHSAPYVGTLFKGKPPVFIGFRSISFGCEFFRFANQNEPCIAILCDNRH